MRFSHLMKYLNAFLKDVILRPSLYFFIVFAVFSVDRHHRYECYTDKNFGPFYSDMQEYYTFLPEYFLDYTMMDGMNVETNKRTIGMAIMYSPAFFVGHVIAYFSGEVQNGYTWPYQWAVRWGSIIYCLFGLLFCRKNLFLFFKEPIVVLALTGIFFGTNLFVYTYGAGEMPHAYLFFLYSAFIYFTLKWIREKNAHLSILPGFILGMIVLIRPTGFLVLLFPLLYDVHSLVEIRERIKLLVMNKISLFVAFILFLIPLIVQMLIWKEFKGHYIFYSYGKEGFFFNDPQIMNFLFSFRKGWLVYTPLMVFSVIGLFLTRKNLPQFFLFITVFFALNIYILSSWWDWAYGGSFGCRVLIESYAFMIFPFASCISFFWEIGMNNKILRAGVRLSFSVILYVLIRLNLFQTWQYKYTLIHWNAMTKESYTCVFLRDSMSKEDIKYLRTTWKSPDYEKMLVGQRDE